MPRAPAFAPSGPAPKQFRTGTHRIRAPEQTVAMVGRLAPALGITRLANVTGLDTIGIPVVTVCRPNARSLSVSQGKGATLAAARASGLMEAVELFHAERITAPLKLASFDELRFTHPMVDVTRVPRPGNSPFHERLRVLWIEATDLVSGEPAWIPYELLHLDCTRPSLPGAGSFQSSSNGLASGNHPWEALVHGICELIERDGLARFEASSPAAQDARRLRLETVDDPEALRLLEAYRRARVDVVLWDTTGPTEVPAVVCGIADHPSAPRRRPGVSYGMGCHPARDVALCRALAEAAQARLTVVSGARDDLSRALYARLEDPEADRLDREWLHRAEPTRSYAQLPTWESDDLAADGEWLLARLQAAGFAQVLAVDLTNPGLDIPVVHVVVPGMQGAGGFTPGVTEVVE